MQLHNQRKNKVKINALENTKKRYPNSTITKITAISFFGFFIGLSISNDHLFLKEILMTTSIICMLLLIKNAGK